MKRISRCSSQSSKRHVVNHPRRQIQGSITAYVVSQPSEKLLKSKDGMKQGKIEAFMKPKSQCKFVPKETTSRSFKKRKLETRTDDLSIETIDLVGTSSPESTLPIEDSPYAEQAEYESVLENNMTDINDSTDASVQPQNADIQPSLTSTRSFQEDVCEESTISSKSADGDDASCGMLVAEKTDFCQEANGKTSREISTLVCQQEHTTVRDSGILCEVVSEQFHKNDGVLSVDLKTLKENSIDQQSSSIREENHLLFHRYEAVDVNEEIDDFGCRKKIVTLQNKSLQPTQVVQLRDEWAELNVEVGDKLNLLLDGNVNEEKLADVKQINAKQNLIVHHPDLLINSTTVSGGLACLRKAVLNERFKNTEMTSDDDKLSNVMLVGTIVHALFQRALSLKDRLGTNEVMNMAREMISSQTYLGEILSLNTTQDALLTDVATYVPNIVAWKNEFMRKSPSAGSTQLDMTLPPAIWKSANGTKAMTHRFKANISLSEVKDIEENVWSPRYGMKGKIDVTGSFTIKENGTRNQMHSILPLELKTGKDSHSMEHHIQVAIYAMFCDERRNTPSHMASLPAGLLLYLKSRKTKCIPLKRADKLGVLMLRNRIADFMRKAVEQIDDEQSPTRYRVRSHPETIDNLRVCSWCPQQRNCALVYHSVDKNCAKHKPSRDLGAVMTQHVAHLTEDDLAYFEHWMTCTLLEHAESVKKKKLLRFWLKSPQKRSEEGNCIPDLRLAGPPVKCDDSDYFLQTFKRESGKQFVDEVFKLGESVLVSGKEPEFMALANGTVVKITKLFITLRTSRDFSGYDPDMTYSIDRHVWMSQISVQSALSNLSILMDMDEHCNRLRKFIISHREPTFGNNLDFIPRSSKDAVASMLRGLNRTQRQAIKRVLLSRDYTLIVGMPGSGKTTTIVAMIRILLLCGLRVLVSSYTHSAVDNLLLKLVRYKVDFLRLGRSTSIHPDVLPFSDGYLSRDFKNPSQLRELYDKARVVGCTCMAVYSHLFFMIPGQKRPMFDVCIVDEASQIAQPACLSPLVHAKRFVLVGDHKQLPPLVVSSEARAMGADESLFRRLTRHQSALCELTLQYRMNRTIMDLSNFMTYEGRLECAHESVATATVTLGNAQKVLSSLKENATDDWLVKSLDSQISVLFMDTSEVEEYEEEVEGGIQNLLEAKMLARLTNYLIKAGCRASQIGIIAPFRKQVKAIETEVQQLEGCTDEVEINTVDTYQGRDKSIILLSFVRSKKEELGERKGELLNDWRRLNVAITRAKHKLVMVGCARSLVEYEPCAKLIGYLESMEMILRVQA